MNKWIIEFVLYFVYLLFGASWAATGSVMPKIMTDFNLNVADASMMSNIILWAKIFGAFCTAILATKLGAKKSYLLGCLMISTSVFMPFIDSYVLLVLIRFLGGLGGSICLVSLVPTVSRFFDNKTASTLNSFNGASNIVGTIIALTLTGYLATLLGGWRNLLAGYGVLTLASAVVWVIVFKDEEKPKINAVVLTWEEKKIFFKTAIMNSYVWGMIVQYSGAIIMMIFMFTYLPLYYSKYAHLAEGSWASYSATVSQIGMVVGSLIGPVFKSKGYHYRNWLFYTSFMMATTMAAMLFATNDIIILVCAFLTGTVFTTWFAFIFSIPKEELKVANTGIVTYAMSAFWVVSFILATINSQLIGWSVDATKSFTVAFTYLISLMAVAPIIARMIFPAKISKKMNII